MNTGILVAMVILVLFSSFFSGAETAFSSINKVKLKSMIKEKGGKADKRIARALELAEDYDVVLSTVLIGNNIVNIACTSLATLFFTGLLGDNSDLGATVSTIVMTIIVLIFGEVTPKTYAKEKADKVVVAITPIIKFFIIVFSPLNLFFRAWKYLMNKVFKTGGIDTVTEEELKTYVDEAHTGGEIDENESELIRSSIEFDDIDVGDILVPRVDVEAIDKYTPFKEIEKVFNTTNFSRLPVYINDIDNIVGVIHHRDFQSARSRNLKSLRTVIKPVPAVSPDTKISKLLRIFQKNKTHLAIVVDEFGGTEGIVTLEDILEELVGEIWDEHDEIQNDIEKLSDNEYLVQGSMSVDDFYEYFGIYQEEKEISTVNGWIMLNLDKIPEVNDTFSSGKLTATVMSMDGKRAEDIKITVKEEENVTEEETI
ncbi:MAG: hemolysin family protein [Clostridium sp.]|nr:hemolysin family protein [Clostridium sp.]